jgi:VWFA-related protein
VRTSRGVRPAACTWRGPLKAFALTVVAFAGFAQSPPTIRVPVRIVSVPTAVVSANGQFVAGLQAENFSIFDNDRSQRLRLDYVDAPLSLAVIVQSNDSVRAWVPEGRRAASTIEALIMGESGEASLTIFGDEVKLVQPMTGSGALLDKSFESVKASSETKSRTLDAVVGAAKELEQVSPERRRVILLIAQSGDVGSVYNLRDTLRELETNNIVVYSLVMPRVGSELIGKSFSLKDAKSAFHRDDYGFVAGVDLGKLIPEIYRAGKASAGQDDLTLITAELGGRLVPFRKLHDLETGISLIGEELHTEYLLSYTPDHYEAGYHRIRVEVNQAGAIVRARPGYYAAEQ